MSNTSASGGYLTPDSSPPADDDLDDILQALVVGVTALDPTMVRPRFQTTPPRQPELNVDWCAIGVTDEEADASPALTHEPDGLGQDTLARHAEIRALASFYGPNAGRNAELLRDGMSIPQNREVLETYLMSFVNSGTIRRVPDLVNAQWIERKDIELRFRRKTERVYQVENIASAAVEFFDVPDFSYHT